MSDQQAETKLIYSFPKSNGEEIQITMRKYQGKFYIDLRQWFRDREQENAELKPTTKGIIFPMERLPEFKEGVDRLLDAWDKIPVKAATAKR